LQPVKTFGYKQSSEKTRVHMCCPGPALPQNVALLRKVLPPVLSGFLGYLGWALRPLLFGTSLTAFLCFLGRCIKH
jgi:hypothetical protein